MAELDVGKLSLTIEADGRAAIFELDRVREAAEGASTDAARAYRDAGQDMADAFEPVKEAAEEAGEAGEAAAKKVGDAAESAGKRTEDANKRATKSIKDYADSMNRIGTNMTATITAPLTALYAVAVNGASDLQETVSKTEVVFGDFSGGLMTWSETAIDKMGMAQGTALSMAGTFGDMATGMGIAESAAASMSMDLTQLTADLASFKNVGTDQVAQALTGIFTGETESLKSLGIVMTQANLQAYALSQGITKQVSAMTQAEQVQLRYNYVMAQTVKAQGDFARTGNSFANQSRKLTETLKEAGEGFGELLIPMVTEVIAKLQEGIEWITQLDDSTKSIILSTGMVIAAVGPLLIVGSKVLSLVAALKTALAALSLNPVLLGVAAVAAAGAAIVGIAGKMTQSVDTASERYRKFEQTLSGGTLGEEIDKLDGKQVSVSWEVSQTSSSNEKEWDSFYDKIEGMDWEAKSFTATGTFDVDPATTEQANAYAEALAAAATATGDYDAAVESLNALLDQQLQAQLAQINQQVDEQTRNLVAMYNEGLIDDTEFDAQIEKIVSGAVRAKEALQEQAEAKKELNEVYANGSAFDDSEAYGEAAKEVYAGETLGTKDFQGALETLRLAAEAGEDMTKYTNEAKVVNQQLAEQAVANYESMIAAQEKYNTAMETANTDQANAEAMAQEAELVQQAIEGYINSYAAFYQSGDETLANAQQNLAAQAEEMGYSAEQIAAMKEELESLLTGSDGLMTADQAYTEYGDGQLFAAYQEQMQTAIAEAEAARVAAAEEFTATLSGLTGEFTAAETQMVMELTASTGAAISSADAELVASVESMIDEMAGAASSGGAEVASAVSGMIANVGSAASDAASQGKSVGAAITSGITVGLTNGTSALYNTVRRIVNNAVAEAKATIDAHSPSRRTAKEIGVPFVQGIAVGAEDETPKAVRTIRQSVEHLISGGTQVVDRGAYTVPAMQSAGAFGIDYDLMGEKLTDAVGALSMVFRVGDTELSRATRESTAHQQAMRAHEINMGRGRVE